MDSLLKYTLLSARRAFYVLLCALIPLACENPYTGEDSDDSDPTETVGNEGEKPSGGKTQPADSLSGSGSDEEEGNGEETDIEDGDGNTDYRKKTYTVDEFLSASLGRRSVRVKAISSVRVPKVSRRRSGVHPSPGPRPSCWPTGKGSAMEEK